MCLSQHFLFIKEMYKLIYKFIRLRYKFFREFSSVQEQLTEIRADCVQIKLNMELFSSISCLQNTTIDKTALKKGQDLKPQTWKIQFLHAHILTCFMVDCASFCWQIWSLTCYFHNWMCNMHQMVSEQTVCSVREAEILLREAQKSPRAALMCCI